MGQLGNLTYREVVRKLRRLGFVFYRQGAGSHEIWRHAATGRKTTVPHHGGNLKERTLRNILEQAGISVEEFLAA
jgi:predicted RNA binding protein YcfA (HicA-like mRNA interferase family)